MHFDPIVLLELLRHPDPAVYRQGIELLRCPPLPLPPDRLLLARLLQTPDRALAVLCDSDEDERRTVTCYGRRVVRRLLDLEHHRRPTYPFPPALALALQPSPPADADARCTAAIAQILERGRRETMALADPDRYSALRLLQATHSLLGDPEPDRLAPLLAGLIHTLSHLEPRRIYATELREREALCQRTLEEALEAQVQALLTPASEPDPAGASSASALHRPRPQN